MITLVLCVRHSCGRADTAILPSHSPNPSDFITRQFHFPTVLPTNCALRDTSLCALHQPVWCSKLGAPGKVDEDRGQTEAKHVVLGIALICICNPFFSRGTSRIKYSLSLKQFNAGDSSHLRKSCQKSDPLLCPFCALPSPSYDVLYAAMDSVKNNFAISHD